MKIALIDNMNNMFFSFARYLRDENIEADLYCLNNSVAHFKPEADTFNNIEDSNYIFELNFKEMVIREMFFISKTRKIFSKYDLIIASGPMISILEKNNIRVDIAIPYGWDLYAFPFMEFNFKKPISSFVNIILSKFQARGLKNSRVLISDEGFSLYKEALTKLGIKSINLGIPMVYSKEIKETKENQFKDNDFIVVNHSRQWWKTKGTESLDDFEIHGGLKRNDKVIKAFSSLLKVTHLKNPLLVLYEYGLDVEASKHLIEELNIEKYVLWLPLTYRKNIMLTLKNATFTTNSFRNSISGFGGVSYESLASGTCHINNTEGTHDNENSIFKNSPVIHALTEKDLFDIFSDYEKHPDKYIEIANKSKEWFAKELGEGLVKKYIALMCLLHRDQVLTQESYEVKKLLTS